MTRQLVTIIGIVFLLSGCSYIKKTTHYQDRETHYLTAKSISPLHVPPGISNNHFKNYYPIPDRNYSNAAKNVDIIPPGLNSK